MLEVMLGNVKELHVGFFTEKHIFYDLSPTARKLVRLRKYVFTYYVLEKQVGHGKANGIVPRAGCAVITRINCICSSPDSMQLFIAR